jgi:amino acid adenylation domain-containing protein
MSSSPVRQDSDAKRLLLENLLRSKGIGRDDKSSSIGHRDPGEEIPLSFAQHRVWFLEQLMPGTDAYNISSAIHIRGRLDEDALGYSIKEVVQRHEALRTVFQVRDDQPIQVVQANPSVQVEVIDLQSLEEDEREESVRFLVDGEVHDPFDLSCAIPIRAKLLRLNAEERILILTLHHIIADERSQSLLLQELTTIYSARLARRIPVLPVLELQYGDYASWQRKWLQGEVLEKQLAYWRKELEGAPPMLHLPTDYPRSAASQFRSGRHEFLIEHDLTEGLARISRDSKATLFMTLLAALQVLLNRYSGQEDIVVGTPVANRTKRELEPLIGLFVNTLALRSQVRGDESFLALLTRVRQKCMKALEHLELPFEKLVEELEPDRDQSRTPLVQVMFVMQEEDARSVQLDGIKLEPLSVRTSATKFDLTCWIQDFGDGTLGGNFEYNADLFLGTTMERMAERFKHLISSILHAPDRPLRLLTLMSSEERSQILVDWNQTENFFPKEVLVHEAFHQTAQSTPEAIALTFGTASLTYAELELQSNQVGNFLRQQGIGPDCLVGICFERSLLMVVVMLGVLKAGGAYVPLDSAYPPERLQTMIKDAKPSLVLVSNNTQKLFSVLQLEFLNLEENWVSVTSQPGEKLETVSHPANLAYVIYTSGSTGGPKGVMITHEGLMNYLSWCHEAYTLDQGIGAPVHSSVSFDLTVTSIFAPLLAERTVMLAPSELKIDDLGNILHQHRDLSLLKLTPAHLNILAYTLRPEQLNGRARVLVIGGEALGFETTAAWRINAPETRLINEYGPTETVVGCCTYEVQSTDPFYGPVPIGRPIQNTSIYILDDYGEPVPVGIAGDIYIGGAGVARGYLSAPSLTASKFIPDGFTRERGARLYQSGDRGRYRDDGTIEYLGRTDYQVKIRGYRIELSEIESSLLQHEAVREAVVVDKEEETGQKRLIGFVAIKEGVENPSSAHLREYLLRKLPEYMVPSVISVLERLPITSNGKVDRKGLPKVERVRSDGEMPRDHVELKLTIIWEDLLCFSGVGRHDNFFALGGHSFMAITLVSRIRDEFACEIPVPVFFENPTVERLAKIIRKDYDPGPISNLVPIQPRGQRPPIFMVHAISGGALCYAALSRRLGPDQPFYGFQAISAEDAKGGRCSSIEERAASYIDAMKLVQRDGPYLLGGWSFGGFVAYEMAQQLMEQGEQVGLLALLDIQPRTVMDDPTNPPTDAELLIMIANDSVQQEGGTIRLKFEEIRHLPVEEQIQRVLDIMVSLELLPAEVTINQAIEFLQGQRRRSASLASYTIRPYDGEITLIRGLDSRTAADATNPTLGWDEFSPFPVKVYTIPANHENLIYPPYVDNLAEVLSFCLVGTDRVDQPSSAIH